MFTRSGEKSRFDSVSVVAVQADTYLDGQIQDMSIKLCYSDSKTGTTYGYIDLRHGLLTGLETLGPEALEAWSKFCLAVEKQQGQLLFGSGHSTQLDLGFDNDQPESREGINVGLGGGT